MNLGTPKDKNFEALAIQFGGADIKAALEHLLTIEEPRLGRLLRSHLVEEVGRNETLERDRVDDLLSYVGILELGAMTGAIPWPLPAALAVKLRQALDLPSMRRYYELYYPLLLPTLFLWRLEDIPLVPYGAFEEEIAYLQQFVVLSDMLNNRDVEGFLWFLDDGVEWDEDKDDFVGLGAFFHVLTKPKQLIRHLGKVENTSPVTHAVRGFAKFLRFAEAFEHDLARMTEQQLLRSALWHYHAYWFYQLSGQVGGVVAASIEEFRKYVDSGPAANDVARNQELIDETYAMMDRSQLALQRLTSSAYRGPLELAYFDRVFGDKMNNPAAQ